jgi:UDP-N-acetylmuramoyl-tripeptide--D-alanyl-D-alanine ligase
LYDIIILEYWIDHPNDMDFLLSIAKPNISIFTKLDLIHLSQFTSPEQIWEEKFKLMHATKEKVYLNYLDDFCRDNFDKIKQDKSYYSWSDIKIQNYTYKLDKNGEILSCFTYNNTKILTNLLWEENLEYIALSLDIIKQISKNIEIDNETYIDITLQNGRFNIVKWINDSILIDSTYNSWPESMKIMIKNTFTLKETLFKDYKIWFVLWDMREIWDKTELHHSTMWNNIKYADFVFTVWESMKKYFNYDWNTQKYLSSRILWNDLKKILETTTDKYIILFKWSQNTIFTEEALKQVLKNKRDEKILVRQDDYWLKTKENFFKTIEKEI